MAAAPQPAAAPPSDVAKMTVKMSMLMQQPTEPNMSSLRRPSFSMRYMAGKVPLKKHKAEKPETSRAVLLVRPIDSSKMMLW